MTHNSTSGYLTTEKALPPLKGYTPPRSLQLCAQQPRRGSKPSVCGRMSAQSVVYVYDRILFSYKEQRSVEHVSQRTTNTV